MAASWAANKKRRVALALGAAVLLVLFASPASARRRPVRLRVYMHDIVGGPGQTAVRLVKGPGPENPSMHPGNYFGDTVVVDDLLTDGLSVGSAAVGRAQGTYMTGSKTHPVFVVSVTLMLTAGRRGRTTAARWWWLGATTPRSRSGSSPSSAGRGDSGWPRATCCGARPG
ncbi:unnamed protein product [Urochloa humidicola]